VCGGGVPVTARANDPVTDSPRLSFTRTWIVHE
jgi:hypothetical protein